MLAEVFVAPQNCVELTRASKIGGVNAAKFSSVSIQLGGKLRSGWLTPGVSFLTLRVSSTVENMRSANGIDIRSILDAEIDLAWHKGRGRNGDKAPAHGRPWLGICLKT